MTHAPHPTQDDPSASRTILVALVGSIMLLALVLFALVLFLTVSRDEQARKLYAPLNTDLIRVQNAQRARISDYHYVDQANGVVAIPIDQAIPLYVQRLSTAKLPPTIGGTTTTGPSTADTP